MSMMSWLVLVHISESYYENLEKECADHLYYVKDENLDKDRVHNTPETEGPSNSHFICNYCKKEVPIEDIPLKTKCNCHFCRDCIVTYVENCLRYDILDSKIIESKEMKKGFSCSVCSCEDCVSLLEAQFLAPKIFKKWRECKDKLQFHSDGFLQCPGCNAVLEKRPVDTPPSGVHGRDSNIMASYTEFLKKGTTYIRCTNCQLGFCEACLAAPYHQGKSCIQSEEEKHIAKCRYCESPISSTNMTEKVEARSKSIRDLRLELNKAGLDISWCIEKKDFVGIDQFESSVCKAEECRNCMLQSCTRKLECGHHCGGILGEQLCLPCLEKICQEGTILQNKGRLLPSRDNICPICQSRSLGKAPSIQLRCGHIVHFHCAKNKLRGGSSGPELTFDFLQCPQCPEIMHHYSIASLLQRNLELLDLVKEKAVNRLRIDGLDKYVNSQNLEDYAMFQYRYYICKTCKAPYCRGTRDLANNQMNRHPDEPNCGGCITIGSRNCEREEHGKKFIKYKCWCCCSVAAWRYDTGEFTCTGCYSYREKHDVFPMPKECKGPEWCPLGLPHGPHNRQYCLGCIECRRLGQ